jgi:hypothetical protein
MRFSQKDRIGCRVDLSSVKGIGHGKDSGERALCRSRPHCRAPVFEMTLAFTCSLWTLFCIESGF